MSYHPVPVTHVGLTVTDIKAATEWYTEAFGCRHIIGPLHVKHDGSNLGEVFKGIFGDRFEEGYVSHLATANGVGIELFEFVTPKSEATDDNFRYWKTGVFHFCLVDPDVEGLARRIAEMLKDLSEGGSVQLPEVALPLPRRLPALVEPLAPEFRVGTIALAWDPSTTRLTLEFRDDMSEDAEGEAPPPINDAPVGPDVLRVALSADAALEFAERALELAAAGRPLCPLCNEPIEATGHR